MSQRITIPQFKEAIQVVSKAFKDLGEQKEVNILPLLGGMGGAANIHLALMRMNMIAQQLENDEQTNKEEQVEDKYKSGPVIL